MLFTDTFQSFAFGVRMIASNNAILSCGFNAARTAYTIVRPSDNEVALHETPLLNI